MNDEWDCFPIKLYLWTIKLEFYKILHSTKYHSFDISPLPTTTICSQVLQKQVVGQIQSRGYGLQTLVLGLKTHNKLPNRPSLFDHSKTSGCFGKYQGPQIKGKEELYFNSSILQPSYLVIH